MLKSPAFLGFSMARRSNRRRLVAISYAILLGVTAAALIMSPSVRHHPLGAAGIGWCLFATYMVVSWSIFGRLAKDTVLPQTRGGEMTSLGLAPPRPHSEHDLDEREVAVRNAAYFTAYRVVAVCWGVVFIAFLQVPELSASTARALVSWLGLLLFEMIFTLPPAVILWREPDVPEEAGV